MRSPISAVTIVKNRTEKLSNLITQLERVGNSLDGTTFRPVTRS